jgi:ubiquitin C-terminal hydrolase
LLDAYVQVVEILQKGETVRPVDFKQILDNKSALFCGYEQQDAHEFMTALLDMLDQDYKTNTVNEKTEQQQNQQQPPQLLNQDANKATVTVTNKTTPPKAASFNKQM